MRLENGLSYGEISKRLKVSKSSVKNWVEDIQLSAEQKAVLQANMQVVRFSSERQITDEQRLKASLSLKRMHKIYNARTKGHKNMVQKYFDLRQQHQMVGRNKIVNEASDLYKAGCMLYWAEGAKHRNSISFSNSDLVMIKLFTRFLFEELKINKSDIVVRVNCYLNNGLSMVDIENFWLQQLGDLPRTCLRKHTVNQETKKKPGTIRVVSS